jgi:hypothetical protein
MPAPLQTGMTATILASLLALLAALGGPPEPDRPPPIERGKDQHFCCSTIADGIGDGCVLIGPENANTCDKVLYCDGGWTKVDGEVTCR